ncbi:Glutaredoxin [Lachnospiraceae bacterium NK3A20]|nr:Glutaredoxin [Lachnospiraceae bacterium NK3A20]
MKLELFHFDTCPFCKMVIREINEEGRTDVEYHDIYKDEASLQRLVEVGGKEQCPCLFVDGKPLYESAEIIRFLKAHPQEA